MTRIIKFALILPLIFLAIGGVPLIGWVFVTSGRVERSFAEAEAYLSSHRDELHLAVRQLLAPAQGELNSTGSIPLTSLPNALQAPPTNWP